MRERPMPNIVQQRRHPHRQCVLIRDRIPRPQPIDRPRRQMKRPQRMSESRVLRRLIRKVSQSQLSHPTQPLKLRRIDQPGNQPPRVAAQIDLYDVMNRIAVISFSQKLNPLSYEVIRNSQDSPILPSFRHRSDPPKAQFVPCIQYRQENSYFWMSPRTK